MEKPTPEMIKERMSLWEKWLLDKKALPVVLIGMSDKGVITLSPEGLGPTDMLKVMEHATERLRVIVQDDKDTLDQDDKDRLIASIDSRHREDYDVEIIEQLNSLPVPRPGQLQDRTRRALIRFIDETYEENIAEESAEELFIKAIMIGLLIDGYNLALLRMKPLERRRDEEARNPR